MARQQLMRKRKLGTVDSPFIHMTDTSRSGYEDSESKRLCTTALNGGKMPRTSEYVHWRVDQVVAYLSSNDFDAKVCAAFKANQLRGSHILLVTEEMLDKMGIKAIGVQKDIIALFRALQQQDDRKVFNDPIHGHFELHPLLVQVIDTPQFQRLRNIKQLGGGYYVFPGASHNRFEHSLGVCHIAGEFVENLQRKQPELGITEVDVLCVKMAGLCHDLGHGPFSHLFDSLFIPRACPNSRRKWRHEDASVTMLDYLLEENELRPEFSRYGLQEQDIVFIKEIIAGPLLDKEKEDEGIEEEEEEVCLSSSEYPVSPDKREVWQYSGRTLEKSFLYEIVANKRNGVDVDKWDYFARDCHCLGIPNNFDMLRYMKFARVISVNGRRQICARDKEVNNLYEMFHTRDGLHRRAYQHKTSNVVELMITEALLEANDHLLLPGKDGRQVKMSEAIYDMTAYSRLTDGVLHQIMLSSNPELEKSKQLILQIEKRRLYKCVGQTQPSRDMTLSEVDIQHQLVESLTPSQLCSLPELTPDDFLVQVVKFDYGMRDKNPIDMMRFYVKGQPDRAVKVRKDQVSQMLPHTFQEKSVRVYCKKLDQDSNSAAWKYFIAWCNKQKQFVTPKGYISSSQEENNDDDDDEEDEAEEGDVVTPYGTPYGTPAKTIVESDGEHSKDGDKQPQLLIEEVKKKLFSQ